MNKTQHQAHAPVTYMSLLDDKSDSEEEATRIDDSVTGVDMCDYLAETVSLESDGPETHKAKTQKKKKRRKKPIDRDTSINDRKPSSKKLISQWSTDLPNRPFNRWQYAWQRCKIQSHLPADVNDLPTDFKPNCYPGYFKDQQNLAVVGSESGSSESLRSLLRSAFRCADRVLTLTPWINYVAFKYNRSYFIYDGCTCNLQLIRHMDLSVGTAGLLWFVDLQALISYIQGSKDLKPKHIH